MSFNSKESASLELTSCDRLAVRDGVRTLVRTSKHLPDVYIGNYMGE